MRERQTDRQTDSETETETERQRETERETERDRDSDNFVTDVICHIFGFSSIESKICSLKVHSGQPNECKRIMRSFDF